jgi:hypothetical protein
VKSIAVSGVRVVMHRSEPPTSPEVWLGRTASDSIAVSIYVVVRDGARRHAEPAAAMRGCVRIRFADDYPPVRIEFRGHEIEVAGRRAIARLADGRVVIDGPPLLARDVLRLLAVDAGRAPARRATPARV